MQVNYDKTQILRIGSLRKTDATFFTTLPLKWSDSPIKILGLQVTRDIEQMTKINYENALNKVQAICETWAKRPLTLLGKKQVINALVAPYFALRCACLPSPDKQQIKKVRQVITNFIWSGKKARISYDRLAQLVSNGGIKLFDFENRDKSGSNPQSG